MDLALLQKLKVLALLEMNHKAWQDTSRFQKGEKSKLCKLIQAKFDSQTPEQITEEFNEIVADKLFYVGAPLDKYAILR